MDGTTACVVLGVPPRATQSMIKKAFRRLAHSAHPDVSGDALSFIELKEAYEVAFAQAEEGPAKTSPKPAEPEAAATRKAATQKVATQKTGKSAWLVDVQKQYPPTARYESLIGSIRTISEPTAADLRHATFAHHLSDALAAA